MRLLRSRLADRTPEQVAEDEARAQREWEAYILDGLEGEERKKRETLILHRRGVFRLSETRRAYEARKKRNYRARRRARAEAAKAALAVETKTQEQ